MSFTVASCPHCSQPTRVPLSLYGQPVKCPHCGAFFQAPQVREDGSFGDSIKLEPSGEKTSPTLLAGLLLLLAGLTGLLVDSTFVLLTIVKEEQLLDEAIRQVGNPDTLLRRWIEIPENFDPVELRDQVRERMALARKFHFPFMGISALICFGGIGVLRQRHYRLGILSCCAAMLNLGFFCCLLGLPVGIYGLIRLLDPKVKALFRDAGKMG